MRSLPGECKKCNGLGFFLLEIEPFIQMVEVDCDICKQPRRAGKRRKVTCEDCGGKGSIEFLRKRVPCRTCHAQGYLVYIDYEVSEFYDYKGGTCE